MKQSDRANARKHQKNKARDFQPELMQHRTEMPHSRPGAAQHGSVSAATCYLLARNPRRNAQFLCRRSISHCSRFYQSPGLEYRFRGRCHYQVRHLSIETGGFVDQQLKQLMKELGEAINESLADSEQIADVVTRIKDGGYDIFLVLEATIGVSRPGEKTTDKTSMVTTLASNPDLKVSEQDLKFLKSLRIKIEDDAA